jgi:hypothetical protein
MTSKMLAKYLGSIELMYKTSFMNNIQICRSACVFLNKGLLCSLSLSFTQLFLSLHKFSIPRGVRIFPYTQVIELRQGKNND